MSIPGLGPIEPKKKFPVPGWVMALAGAVVAISLVALFREPLGLPKSDIGPASPTLSMRSERIGRAQLGEAWPLTVDEGVLECRGIDQVVFTAGGVTYAVNGMAAGKYPSIRPIWLPHPTITPGPGFADPKKYIGPLIDRGLALCGMRP